MRGAEAARTGGSEGAHGTFRMGTPPAAEPVDVRTDLLDRLKGRAGVFAAGLVRNETVWAIVRTDTRVDVGSWLGRRRAWAVALDDALLLFAHGPRPYAERTPYATLRDSTYNHVTGELVLGPGPAGGGVQSSPAASAGIEAAAGGPRVRRLRMAPHEAWRLLAEIHGRDTNDA